jgi:hypothetical protein
MMLAFAVVATLVALAPEAAAATCMGVDGPACCAQYEWPGPYYDNCLTCVAGGITWWDTVTHQCYL